MTSSNKLNNLVLKYAALTGKYVLAERPATINEKDSTGNDLWGGMGLVACVESVKGREDPGGNSTLDIPGHIAVTFDYGMGFAITEENEHLWRFRIWPDFETAELFERGNHVEADQLTRDLNKRSRFGTQFHVLGDKVYLTVQDARCLLAWANTTGSAHV